MSLFRIKDRGRCKARMHCMYPGGVIMCYEDHCRLPVNHEGFHRGEKGTVWDNNEARMGGWEKAAEKTNRPMIFLGKK